MFLCIYRYSKLAQHDLLQLAGWHVERVVLIKQFQCLSGMLECPSDLSRYVNYSFKFFMIFMINSWYDTLLHLGTDFNEIDYLNPKIVINLHVFPITYCLTLLFYHVSSYTLILQLFSVMYVVTIHFHTILPIMINIRLTMLNGDNIWIYIHCCLLSIII